MARLFLYLEEVAEKLGISDSEARSLGANGDLQVFRDRDKIMFKVDDVERYIERKNNPPEPEPEPEPKPAPDEFKHRSAFTPDFEKITEAARKIAEAHCVFNRVVTIDRSHFHWQLIKPKAFYMFRPADEVFRNMPYEQAVVLASEEL
tara:strand:- start:3614 stop:4057 length:444 start_codon:yes stop_codon:yes gene_type:complete